MEQLLIFNILAFILGTMFGSFISVLMHRIYHKENGMLFGRSKCPQCGHVLNPKDLIPILSYALKKGSCSYCQKKIGIIYPIVELITGITFLILFNYVMSMFAHGATLDLYVLGAFYILSFLTLIFTFFYDILYMEISDRILLPMILIALLMPFLTIYPLSLFDVIIGALIPTAFFLTQILISKGKWIGGGDLRIGAFMGALLGWQSVIVALLLSYFVGAIISLVLITTPKFDKKSMIPFGPFLVIGTVIAFFYGENIIEWYLNMIYV